ncbi:MAG: hypothetical protein NVS2B17_33690 [Candidatus Velthaea sp.]
MPTLGQALNAVAGSLFPLLGAVSGKTDPQSQADAASLTRTINVLVTDAMLANAQDVEAKLDGDAAAMQRLTNFTASANAKATELAASQANVSRFASLATHVGAVVVAAAAGNVAGCSSALFEACKDLGIATR